jgi:hypothetical protein
VVPGPVIGMVGDGAVRASRPRSSNRPPIFFARPPIAHPLEVDATMNGQLNGSTDVFARPGAGLDRWPGCLALADEVFPDKPVVGYESGDRLVQAASNGCQSAGPLRVWVNGGGAV